MMLPLYEGLMTIGAPAIELLLSKRVKRGKARPRVSLLFVMTLARMERISRQAMLLEELYQASEKELDDFTPEKTPLGGKLPVM